MTLDLMKSIQWKEIMPLAYGKCFTMTFPQEILKKGIESLKIKQDLKELDLIFHTKGALKYPTQGMGVYSLNIKSGQDTLHKMNYDHIHLLHFGEDNCNDTKEYDLDQCIIDAADRLSMELHGCSTIFGNDPDLACNDYEKAASALQILFNEVSNPSICKNPCRFLTNSLHSSILVTEGINETTTSIFFTQYIKNVESKYIYNFWNMVAEFGGYVGLFLGFSLLNLNDLLAWIWNNGMRWKHHFHPTN